MIESGTVSLGDSRWRHAPHVDYLDRNLVELAARQLPVGYIGLIIEEPPRHGKSELASHYFPAWYLGTFPHHRVILASYEAEFAATWGRKTRDTLEEYGEDIFSVRVARDTRAADEWSLVRSKGGMKTAGIRGAITGRGGNLIIVDDPFKNREEANSETIRNRVWDNFTSAVLTRREMDLEGLLEGIVLVIGTRWHEDDMIGRLLMHMEDDDSFPKFKRIRLPAIAEEPDEEYPWSDPLGRKVGEALWPEKFGLAKLEQIRATSEQDWISLYQQRPAPKEGSLFLAEWFEIVGMPSPRFKRVVRRWDLAATDPKAGSDPDWSVGVKFALHEDGFYYILDVVRVRESPGKLMQTLRSVALRDGRLVKIRIEQEPGSAGKIAIWQIAKTALREFNVRGERSTGSKEQRADTAAAAAERGEVKIVRGKWTKEFLKEIKRFPFSTHDDQVDAFSGAFEDLTKRSGRLVTW